MTNLYVKNQELSRELKREIKRVKSLINILKVQSFTSSNPKAYDASIRRYENHLRNLEVQDKIPKNFLLYTCLGIIILCIVL